MIDAIRIRVPKAGYNVQGTLVFASTGEEIKAIASLDLHFRPGEVLTASLVAYRDNVPGAYILERVPAVIEVAYRDNVPGAYILERVPAVIEVAQS